MELPPQTSPAESFVSTPGDNYSSLFAVSTPGASHTVNPMDMMTPSSSADDGPSRLSAVPEDAEMDTPGPDDSGKPTKKRKSWGQVLPEPKTNLPPRKRAKTDDEKEQRRVERVLRNRRAAQSSRERKRLEVEALEQRNKELEDMLLNAQKANQMLVEELSRFQRDNGAADRASPLDSLRDNVTLSQQLFSSQDGLKTTLEQSSLMSNLMNPTVNPASLSPELGPVDSANNQSADSSEDAKPSEQTLAPSPDLTQHPAEVLSDLPCHTSAEVPKSFLASQTSTMPLLALSPLLRTMLLSASTLLSACHRPLTQIAMSSRAGFSLLPTPQLLTTIIWLLTLPPASPPSTSTTSSPTTQTTSPQNLWQRATTPLRTTASTSRSLTLRLKSLRKILSSSPNLARPLMDATMVALRLVSEGRDDRVGILRRESEVTRDVDRELTDCLSGIALPSREVLLTLLWALKVEERRISRRRSDAVLDPETGAPAQPNYSNQSIELKVAGVKRRRQPVGGTRTRCRLT